MATYIINATDVRHVRCTYQVDASSADQAVEKASIGDTEREAEGGPGEVADRHVNEMESELKPFEDEFDDDTYTICKHCDHFVEENAEFDHDTAAKVTDTTFTDEDGDTYARYVHLEDGEQEFDHDAEPGETKTGAEWERDRPDLFKKHPDSKVGPNSTYHPQRGKDGDYEDGEVMYMNADGHLVWWDEAIDNIHTTRMTVGELNVDDLTAVERSRCGLPPLDEEAN